MAHGNTSDLVFLALLAAAVQWAFFPASLFEDVGPLKAQFKAKSADVDAMLKVGAGLLLMLGLALSGVKWNPINGKMAGAAGLATAAYTAYTTFKADAEVFVPRFSYVYAAVILLGALHIFAFPANPLPPKTPETKNNHGNLSDGVALLLLAASGVSLAYPEHLFQDIGPLKAQFSGQSPDLSFLIKFNACLISTIALIFSGVKWNPINGKMVGVGGLVAAGATAYAAFSLSGNVFVPQLLYIYALIISVGALHILAFPSNPLPAKPKKT